MSADGFYAGVPVFSDFRMLMDPAHYRPLPEGWLIGVADVVASTAAIAAGRYKAVNMAGAAVIAAVGNALARRPFPYAFGGDGASFAVAPEDASAAREALAATAAFARDDLDLSLRVALLPVEAVRAQGLDLRVARYAPSPHVSYAMFAGGGLAFAERVVKAGEYAVAPAVGGAKPDLSGLSCRWDEAPARHGVILSLVVVPAAETEAPAFRALVEELITLVETSPEAGRPVTDSTLTVRWPPQGFDFETRAARGGGPLARRLKVLARTLVSTAIFRSGLRVGRFDPAVYRRELLANTDFRKYDDGLRMTLDCTPALADRIAARLDQAEAAGVAHAGLHRQGAALVTCITPNPTASDHVHFVDGAAGGYASAARRLKEKLGVT
ncbi:MAG TPA: DUF3095 domain-containing protein [Beijerinckiaceae bacterium]|jgi:hypothetical protein